MPSRRLTLSSVPSMLHRSCANSWTRSPIDLTQGEEAGLADEVAVEEPETNVSLTVARTRSGMSNRRRALEGHPPPPEAEAVQEQLDAQIRRKAQVAALLARMDDIDRFERLVQKNEERVRTAVAAWPAAGSGGVRALEEEKVQLDDEIVQLAGRRRASSNAWADRQCPILSLSVNVLRRSLRAQVCHRSCLVTR